MKLWWDLADLKWRWKLVGPQTLALCSKRSIYHSLHLCLFSPICLSHHPGLPDEKGRVQILNIHTSKMREFNLLAGDVDVKELAAETKNYSGAELEGLVRAAQSTAMNRHIKVQSTVQWSVHSLSGMYFHNSSFERFKPMLNCIPGHIYCRGGHGASGKATGHSNRFHGVLK